LLDRPGKAGSVQFSRKLPLSPAQERNSILGEDIKLYGKGQFLQLVQKNNFWCYKMTFHDNFFVLLPMTLKKSQNVSGHVKTHICTFSSFLLFNYT
jgi:hypothetical protein